MPTAVHRICPACEWPTTAAEVDPVASLLVCDRCGARTPFQCLPPLLFLTGASGAGKTTLYRHLLGRVRDVILIDQDLLWSVNPAHNDPASGYRAFRGLILHLAERVAANGLPVLVEGTCVPEQYESLGERWYFSKTAYLAVVCDPDVLRQRLLARPGWRRESVDVEAMITLNDYYRHRSFQPRVELLDTTGRTEADCAQELHAWIRQQIGSDPLPAPGVDAGF